MSMKSFKSPGGNGIISDFCQLYWEANGKYFCEVINDMFYKFELTDSQYNGNAITQG